MFFGELVLQYPAALYIAKYGPKHSIALSMPLLFVHFILLQSLPTYHWPIWLLSLTGSISVALFWQAYHLDFAKAKHNSSAAKEVSRLFIMLTLVGAFAPFVGGTIASEFGISILFILVLAILFLAIIPLFQTGEPHIEKKLDLKKLYFKKIANQLIAYGSAGYESSASMIIWPLFIFLILGTYQKVGFVTSIALLFMIAIAYVLGKRADKEIKTKYIKVGGFFNGIIYFLKITASTILHVFFFNFASSISHSIITTPFDTEYYLHSDEGSKSEYIFMMEISIAVIRILFFGMLYILSFYFEQKTILVIGLLFAGVASFLMTLMPPAKSEIEIKDKTIKIQRQLKAKETEL